MEPKRMIELTVGIVVGLVVFSAILMPVINNTTTTERTFTNDGAFYVELDPTDTYTVDYDKSANPGVVYINDEAMDVPFSTGYTILAIDNAILRLQSGDSTLQYKGDNHYFTGISYLKLTVSNGSIAGEFTYSGGGPYSWPDTTYTECYIASPTKEAFVMTEYNTTHKVMGDSQIHAFGQTTFTTNDSSALYLVKIDGTIDDGADVSILNATTGEVVDTATIEDLQINATPTTGYIDLYDLTSITFKAKILDTDDWTNVTYSAYIVPTEVTAELSDHLDGDMIGLLKVIPILIIAGLILGIATVVISRRE